MVYGVCGSPCDAFLHRCQHLQRCIAIGLHPSVFTVRRYASAVFAVVMCPSARPSQADIVSKRLESLDESSCLFARRLPSSYPTLYNKEMSVYLQKVGYFPLELCPKLRTSKISRRQVDRVVNKTSRGRRRSSLLTTSIWQPTSCGCLLQVGQL